MTPEESEEVDRLLTAAQSDLRAAEALAADPAQANDVIGFHAQQAVEKALQAMLVAAGAAIPHTHDIVFLIELVANHADAMPELVAQPDWLTPWAVAARYGATDVSLDREASITVARAALDWAAAKV